MPAMTDKLSPMELRDVIAYLGSLHENPSSAYRVGFGQASGPQVLKPASGIAHAGWLPVIVLGIAGSLAVLLLLTVASTRMPKA